MEYKKIISLGKIDYWGDGTKCPVSIYLELKEENDKNIFSASASVGDVMGGQCFDELKPFFKNNTLFNGIYRLWKLYHLNDMHPECEHQHQLGWHNLAKKEIVFNIYKLNYETLAKQNEIEKFVLDSVKKGDTVKLSPQDQKILSLAYTIKTDKNIDENLKQYYKLDKHETQFASFTTQEESSHGLLGKECPVCHYRYGSSWQYFPIPLEDLSKIKNIMEI